MFTSKDLEVVFRMKKTTIFCRVITWLMIAVPFVMISIALGAGLLGVDSDQRWGPFRVGLLILGFIGLVIVMGSKVLEALDNRLDRNLWPFSFHVLDVKRSWLSYIGLQSHLQAPGPIDVLEHIPSPDHSLGSIRDESTTRPNLVRLSLPTTLGNVKAWSGFVLLFIVIELLYVFFVSVGHWVIWPSTTNYYDLLAEAFIQGKAALPIEPSPLLAELDDPYTPAERAGIPVVYDASYFRGEYYLYWGPAPAAVTALWKLTTMRHVGDEHIVFVAVSSIFTFSMLIILYIKKKYFPSIPGWLLATGILIVATAHPMLWVLNWPSIYPAAIASGQAFLLAGLYFAIPVIDASHRQLWRLLLIGILWALALGSRLTLIVAVAVLVIAIVINLLSRIESRHQITGAVTRIAALGLPLLIGIGLLGLYNYVRFGSVIETGLRYQLSKLDHLLIIEGGKLFSAAYILPNMIYYLLAPLQFRTSFPFIRPLWHEIPSISSFLERFNVPDAYHVENITGLLLALPTVVFSGLLIRELLCYQIDQGSRVPGSFDSSRGLNRDRLFRRTMAVLLIAGLMAAVPVVLYFWVSNRFLLDSVPLLAITAVVGTWLLYSKSRKYTLRRAFTTLLIISVVITASLISFLLAITGSWTRFDDLNPVLWKSLTDFFAW